MAIRIKDWGGAFLVVLVGGLLLIAANPAATIPESPLGTCPTVSNTPFFTIAYGTVTINGSPAPIGTAVEARNPRGDTVGCFEVTSTGNFGTMYVYGEDTSVVPSIPGMRAGETVRFFIDGVGATAVPLLTWVNDQDLHQVSLSASGSTNTPTATSVNTPTSTSTATATSTSTATPTPTVTNTPTTTATNTATPTATNTTTVTPIPFTPEYWIYLPAVLK